MRVRQKYPGRCHREIEFSATRLLDFAHIIHRCDPACVGHPEVFMCGEQGILNYVLLKTWQKSGVSLEHLDYYRWGEIGAPDVKVADLLARKTAPLLIHWAGPKSDNIREMSRADLLKFYQDYDNCRIQTAG